MKEKENQDLGNLIHPLTNLMLLLSKVNHDESTGEKIGFEVIRFKGGHQ